MYQSKELLLNGGLTGRIPYETVDKLIPVCRHHSGATLTSDTVMYGDSVSAAVSLVTRAHKDINTLFPWGPTVA